MLRNLASERACAQEPGAPVTPPNLRPAADVLTGAPQLWDPTPCVRRALPLRFRSTPGWGSAFMLRDPQSAVFRRAHPEQSK